MPEISVILPAYNGERYIRESVESVLRQTYRDFEFIVVDDGSTDKTRKILDEYKNDIIYHYQENRGFSGATDQGILLARGKYISFIGQDDIFLPEKLERQIGILAKNPQYALVYSPCVYIDENGKELRRWGGIGKASSDRLFYLLYTRRNFIVHPSVMLRKDVLANFVRYPFDPSQKICSDHLLYLLLAAKYEFYEYPEPLVKFRSWNGQLSSNKQLTYSEDRKVLSAVRDVLGKGSLKFFFFYRIALANQYFEEGVYHLKRSEMRQAIVSMLKSIVNNPLNFGTWFTQLFAFLNKKVKRD